MTWLALLETDAQGCMVDHNHENYHDMLEWTQ
jgi:hypothetical protein